MTSKDGQPVEPDSPSNYEAAVLDFLDKEMASVQSTLTEKKQSEELDALVANLLHQVIAESDEAQTGDMIVSSEDMNDLLAEFEHPQEAAGSTQSAPPLPEPEPVQVSGPAEEPMTVAAQTATREPKAWEAEHPESIVISAAMFASPAAQRKRMHMIVAAVVCLVAIVGFAVYYFSNTPEKAKEPAVSQVAQPPAAINVAENPPAPATISPKAKAKTPSAPTVVAEKKPVADNSKAPAPVAASQKPPVSQTAAPPAIAASKANPPAHEERSIEQQIAPSAPPVIPQAVPEKAAPPVVTENPAPASTTVERKPAPQPPIVPASTETTAPAPEAKAPAAAVQKNLVAAVAIAQVSPKFPEFAVRTRSSGQVLLLLDVDKQGKVAKATPIGGPEMFYREAINAAMQWRYKPASVDGVNIPSQVKVTFTFNLKK